jgi:hypothetical protein
MHMDCPVSLGVGAAAADYFTIYVISSFATVAHPTACRFTVVLCPCRLDSAAHAEIRRLAVPADSVPGRLLHHSAPPSGSRRRLTTAD